MQLDTILSLAKTGEDVIVMVGWNIERKDRKKSVSLKTSLTSLSKITKAGNEIKSVGEQCCGVVRDLFKELSYSKKEGEYSKQLSRN